MATSRRVAGVAGILLVVGLLALFIRLNADDDACRDSASLQRRIDRAGPGAVLTLTGEHCLAERIVITGKRGLTLQGDGTANLRQGPAATDKMFVLSDATDVTLRRLEVTGASVNAGNRPGAYSHETAGSSAIAVKGAKGVRLEDLHVHDVYGDFVDLDEGLAGAFTSNVVIKDNLFERSGRQGISFGTNIRTVTVEGNRFDGVRRSVFDFEPGVREAETSDVSIVDNRVNDFRNFFVTVAGLGRLHGLVIERNEIAVKGGNNGGLGFVRVGRRKEGIPLVSGLRLCANEGDLMDEVALHGAADPVTTCG